MGQKQPIQWLHQSDEADNVLAAQKIDEFIDPEEAPSLKKPVSEDDVDVQDDLLTIGEGEEARRALHGMFREGLWHRGIISKSVRNISDPVVVW